MAYPGAIYPGTTYPRNWTAMDSSVSAKTSRVLVNGVQRDVFSWSVDRELAGDMPAQVVDGSGVMQATGSIEWAAAEDVASSATNPWNQATGWIPARGDRVEIFVGDGLTEWKQFHGIIDKTTGKIGNGFQSEIIDDFDKLSTTLTHAPLLRVMPPETDGGAYRGVGLSSLYYVDAALRRAGFYATPADPPNTALSVTGQGSLWPTGGLYGQMVLGGSQDGIASHGEVKGAPWGVCMSNFNCTYRPAHYRPANGPLQISLMIAPTHTGNATVDVNFGSLQVRLAAWGTGAAAAYLGTTQIVGLTVAQMAGASVITLLSKGGVFTLKTDTGASVSAPAAIASTTNTTFIVLSGAPDARIAGIQVSHPDATWQEFTQLAHKPTARLRSLESNINSIIDAAPALDGVRVSDLLEEIGKQTLTAGWIDETGVFQRAPSVGLGTQAPTQTLSTDQDIFGLDWSDDILGVRSKVTVVGKVPSISTGRYRSKELYRGGGESLTSEQTSEEIAEPDADTDWILPDESLTVLGPGSWGTYNAGGQAFAGAFYSASGATTTPPATGVTVSMTKVGVQSYKITHAAGVFPPDVTANLATSPTDAALWPRNQDKSLPVIPGFGKVVWREVSVTSLSAGGAGPELVFDAGVWSSRRDSNLILENIAAYLSGQTAVPKPVIHGLDVLYDPRRKLGDVVDIVSTNLLGVTIRALIVGISIGGGQEHHQSLSVRVISATTSFTTFEEFNKHAGGSLTFQQWQALGPTPETFAQFNTAA